jgi:putative transposase
MNNIVSLPDVKSIFKEIMSEPSKMFDLLRIDLKSICEQTLGELIKSELTQFLGREKYCRFSFSPNGQAKNYRNGYYTRSYTVKNIGNLKVQVSRDRLGKFNSGIINKYERYEKSLEKDLALMFLSGLSTRGISLISQSLIGRKISPAEVSRVNEKLLTGIEAWRERSLHDFKIKYIFVDGVNFDMRVEKSIEKVPMLIAIGVTESNQRLFLCIQQGDKDSATTWREIFKDIKNRGLAYNRVQLGIMDGLPGLEKVFKEEFPNSKVQRCQVHVARNVLTKVPRKMKGVVADRLRDIFYASKKERAIEHYRAFLTDYEKITPSAVKSLKNSIEACLTFFSYPSEEWRSLRTTNCIERVNKEFKRRTKPMEILAGEKSAYRLLCFIALKMELNWRSAPFGKENLPAIEKFTQNT